MSSKAHIEASVKRCLDSILAPSGQTEIGQWTRQRNRDQKETRAWGNWDNGSEKIPRWRPSREMERREVDREVREEEKSRREKGRKEANQVILHQLVFTDNHQRKCKPNRTFTVCKYKKERMLSMTACGQPKRLSVYIMVLM